MRAGAAMLLMEPPDAPPVLHVGAGVDAAWFPDTASAASPATQATLERVRGRVRLLLHPLVCTAGHPSNVRPAFPPPSASPPIQLYDTTLNGNTVLSLYARTTVRSERKLNHCLTL
jgi:hypothetical protein